MMSDFKKPPMPKMDMGFTLALALAVAVLAPLAARAGEKTIKTEIRVDTVWTAAESPYSLSEDIVVHPGATLTMEPGVTVYGNGKAIRVAGNLEAVGTVDQPIVMVDVDVKPDLSRPKSIIKLGHVRLTYAKNGLTVTIPGLKVFSEGRSP